jgi:hypothetical protein
MFHEACRSIRADSFRAFFFWLTFVLAAALVILFSSLGSADQSAGSVTTLVTLIVLVLCSVDIFVSNDFYVKAKAKDMAVRLICGASFFQLASWLLLQTFLLLVTAVPVGILLAVLCLPAVSSFLPQAVSISSRAAGQAALIIGYVIFWTVLLNLSFAYTNAAGMLLNPGTVSSCRKGSIFHTGSVPEWLKGIAGLILFLLPVPVFFWNPSAAVPFSLAGMAGLMLVLRYVVSPYLTWRIHEHALARPRHMASLGFIRRDLSVLEGSLLLYLLSAVVLVSLLGEHTGREAVMVFVCFLFLTVLQGMTVLFRFLSELPERREECRTLGQLGFRIEDLQAVIKQEAAGVYGFLFVCVLLYPCALIVSLGLHHLMFWQVELILMCILIIPLLLSALTAVFSYQKGVLIHTEKRRKE